MKNKKNKVKCPICNVGFLEDIVSDYDTFVKDGIREIRIIVKDLKREKCLHCNEEFLSQEALDRIQVEKYKKLDLLTPEKLKSIREKLDRTQEEMSDLLGVGKKSYFRWENGFSIQNKSIDRYIRLVAENPENVFLLEKLRRQKEKLYNKEKLAEYFDIIHRIDVDKKEKVPIGQVGYKAEIPDELKEKVKKVIKKYLEKNKNE